jgi:DNA replication and repair protein RecF
VAEDVPDGLDGDRFTVSGSSVERLAQEASSGGRM